MRSTLCLDFDMCADISFAVPTTETTIKTLYVFVEIAIDSSHLAQTVRLNFPTDREQFYQALLESEDLNSKVPAGRPVGPSQHLRIEGPSYNVGDSLMEEASLDLSTHSESPATREPTRLALVSTIQFVAALSRLKDDLTTPLSDPRISGLADEGPNKGESSIEHELSRPRLFIGKYEATIPRSKPLSPGEILGCTAPRLSDDIDALMYVLST